MIVELDEAKMFLRLDNDYTDEDMLVQSLELAAEEHLLNATGIVFDSTNNLAKLYINVLLADFYNDRGITQELKSKTRTTLASIVLQLQYAYAMPAMNVVPAGSINGIVV